MLLLVLGLRRRLTVLRSRSRLLDGTGFGPRLLDGTGFGPRLLNGMSLGSRLLGPRRLSRTSLRRRMYEFNLARGLWRSVLLDGMLGLDGTSLGDGMRF